MDEGGRAWVGRRVSEVVDDKEEDGDPERPFTGVPRVAHEADARQAGSRRQTAYVVWVAVGPFARSNSELLLLLLLQNTLETLTTTRFRRGRVHGGRRRSARGKKTTRTDAI